MVREADAVRDYWLRTDRTPTARGAREWEAQSFRFHGNCGVKDRTNPLEFLYLGDAGRQDPTVFLFSFFNDSASPCCPFASVDLAAVARQRQLLKLAFTRLDFKLALHAYCAA